MTIWVSHRGYTKDATENTAQAFDAAIDLGFTHLETDLRTTRDGHIVLCHDPDLARISASSAKVDDLTRHELEAITLAKGESLLFFDEFLARYSHLNWILDIKPESAVRTITALEGWLKHSTGESFLRNQARFLMWHPAHEVQIKQRLDNALCLARDKACVRAGVAALAGLPALGVQKHQVYAVPPRLRKFPILSAALVRRYQRRGAKVIGYLPETLAEHQQALAAGVDELLTNHAHLIKTLAVK